MRQDVERLATEIAHTYGGLDGAINNAAIEGQKGFLEGSEDEWDAMVSINLKSVWLCMRSEIPSMLGRGGGAYVSISYVCGLLGLPLHAPYEIGRAHAELQSLIATPAAGSWVK